MTVTGLGAWCDYVTEAEYRKRLLTEEPSADVTNTVDVFKRGIGFVVHEFARLADGRRLILHEEAPFTIVTREPPPNDWRLTTASVTRAVRQSVIRDHDTEDEHPWEWLAELLSRHGVEATIEELKSVPYVVEFSERLRAHLVDT